MLRNTGKQYHSVFLFFFSKMLYDFPVIASLKGEAIRKEVTGLLRVNPRNDARN
ncbi:MAG: hypothetical protein LBL79_07475 [Prevotella sp.]|jgi:hypothetical protein|nr:hypothetical protein [Prevotella sp.]